VSTIRASFYLNYCERSGKSVQRRAKTCPLFFIVSKVLISASETGETDWRFFRQEEAIPNFSYVFAKFFRGAGKCT
jgi:hypothetical protein